MSNRPIRVLQVLTAMNRGGAETMIMNYYRALDKTKVQFDFIVHRQQRGDYDDEIERMGGRIFRAFPIRPWNYLSYFNWLNKFFKKNARNYVAVHSHIQENSGFPLMFAKKYGIKTLVSHSHIADLGIDYKYLFRQFGKIFTNKYANVKLACGVEAGKFLYGERDFEILRNAIPAKDYAFSETIRKNVRENLGISDSTYCIGSVARLCPQKNHEFMIRIFSEYHKKHPDSLLVLAGTGPLLDSMKDLTKRLNIEKSVRFLGLRSDIPDLLQSFDVFLMPSLFEGLPVSLIEAQAADLPIVVSNVVDKDCDFTDNLFFVGLDESPERWCEVLERAHTHTRKNTIKAVREAKYDVEENTRILLDIYTRN